MNLKLIHIMKFIKSILLTLMVAFLFNLNTNAQSNFIADKYDKIENLKTQLDLSPNQVIEVKRIIKNNLTEDDFNKAKLNKLYNRFKTEKRKSNPDNNKIELLIDQIAQERAENTKKRYAAQTKIKSILTPEQNEKLKQIIFSRKKGAKRS